MKNAFGRSTKGVRNIQKDFLIKAKDYKLKLILKNQKLS
jgi:hypothetical protein